MQLTTLWLPFLCVIGITALYGGLFRWLFRGGLDQRLAWLTFAASAGLIGLSLAGFFLGNLGPAFMPGLLAALQSATSLPSMIQLALTYAALPEEAVKIGAVVLLLLLLPRWIRNASDPAEMLLYSALGFAMCESLLYVIGFAETPQFQDHLIVFALMRGVFGGLLHASLALVAGFGLAGHWRTPARWLWVLISYATAVVFHATFDGSLLHLVFQSLGQTAADSAAKDDTSQTAIIFGLCFVLLLILAVLSLRRSRRLPV